MPLILREFPKNNGFFALKVLLKPA